MDIKYYIIGNNNVDNNYYLDLLSSNDLSSLIDIFTRLPVNSNNSRID